MLGGLVGERAEHLSEAEQMCGSVFYAMAQDFALGLRGLERS